MKLNSDIAAIVTGGGSGLGAAVITALRDEGVKVTVFDLKPGDSINYEESGVHFVSCDVTSEDSCLSAFKLSREKIGQERILVNCAGINFAAKTASVKFQLKFRNHGVGPSCQYMQTHVGLFIYWNFFT